MWRLIHDGLFRLPPRPQASTSNSFSSSPSCRSYDDWLASIVYSGFQLRVTCGGLVGSHGSTSSVSLSSVGLLLISDIYTIWSSELLGGAYAIRHRSSPLLFFSLTQNHHWGVGGGIHEWIHLSTDRDLTSEQSCCSSYSTFIHSSALSLVYRWGAREPPSMNIYQQAKEINLKGIYSTPPPSWIQIDDDEAMKE